MKREREQRGGLQGKHATMAVCVVRQRDRKRENQRLPCRKAKRCFACQNWFGCSVE